MIDADERSGLSKPVTLNHGKAEPPPEFLGSAIERRTTGDEGPEFPSELAMGAAENPPAAQEMLAFSGSEGLAKFVYLAVLFEIAFNLFFQRLQDARDRGQHRHMFAVNATNYIGGL